MDTFGAETTMESGAGQVGSVSFTPDPAEPGLTIIDSIERHRYTVTTSTSVTPTRIDTDQFLFPVDSGVAITTTSLTLPTVVAVYIHDGMTGEVIGEAEHFAAEEFPTGTYSIELSAPIKLYLQITGSVTVESDMAQTHLDFGEDTEVFIGGRSYHDRPAATITTPADPSAMMTAISTFGSALKTTSCERSYPTLRGHPPTINLGDSLDIPDGLETPDTGIRLELPPDYESIFVAAPLAYYLGATVEEGETPRLVTDSGFEHHLDSVRGFEAEVERVLKQTFFLDCLTRTEGYYQVELHERDALESELDLEFDELYGQPLANQIAAYLDVPYTAIADQVPEWKLTTHVEPTPSSIETLPFTLNDLPVVKTPRAPKTVDAGVESTAVTDFMRDDSFTRSAGSVTTAVDSYVQPETMDSLEQTWIGEGTPVGAGKATTEAFRNRLDRTPTTGEIDITVVCNDLEMNDEQEVVNTVYGSREELPFSVTVKQGLTTAELRDTLTADTDFLHYIGHIDDAGFDCVDGAFDAATLETVGVDAFLLNACQSYTQGMELLTAGSIGGVVTLSEVLNSGAVRIGRTMARLLNNGFPLRAALNIARGESIIGGKYIVVGDGGMAIAQSESGAPNLCEVTRAGESFEVEYRTYPTTNQGMGTMVVPMVAGNDDYFLASGGVDTFEMSKQELAEFLALETVPIRIDGQLQWSNTVDVDDL